MNEILYRGKRKRSMGGDGWLYGSYATRKNIITGEFIHEIGFQLDGQEHLTWIEIIPETCGQFTGINDKNNRPIFKGDIVSTGRWSGKVFMRLGCWYVENYLELGYLTEPYVIGNIHDNPELLEKK